MSTPKTFEQAVDAVLAQMRAVMIDRQRKYGNNNIRALGLIGVLRRALHDKGNRLLRLYEREELRQQNIAAGMPKDVIDKYLPAMQGDFTDESIEDAHIDGGNFIAVISVMLRRGWWGLPMEEELPKGEG